MAESVKKGTRITGADRSKLAGELTKKSVTEETGEESVRSSENTVPVEPGPDRGVAGPTDSPTQ